MSPEKFHNRYRISSARAPWHGYMEGVISLPYAQLIGNIIWGKFSVVKCI